MNAKTYIAGLGTFLILAVGCYLLASPNPKYESAEQAAQIVSEHKAMLIKQGYSPENYRFRVTKIIDKERRIEAWQGQRLIGWGAITQHTVTIGKLPKAYSSIGHPKIYDVTWRIALALIFLILMLRIPLRSITNLDLTALGVLLLSQTLWREGYWYLHLSLSFACLLYLLVRSLQVATRGAGPPRQELIKLPQAVVIILAGVYVLVTGQLSLGSEVVDVAQAASHGATSIIEAKLPYQHPELQQGHLDTYPILYYLSYLPLALLFPTSTLFDSFIGVSLFTWLSYLAVGLVIYLAAKKHLKGPRAGYTLTLGWLGFPLVISATTSGTSDIIIAFLVSLFLLHYNQARLGFSWLALGGFIKLFPFALLPFALSRQRGKLGIQVLIVLSLLTLSILTVIMLGGASGIKDMLTSISYQFNRSSVNSVWGVLDIPLLQFAFQLISLALIVVCFIFWLKTPELKDDLPRLAALMAAVGIAVQLAANYWTYSYFLWVYPLVLFGLFAHLSPEDPKPASPRSSSEPASSSTS